MWPPSSDSDPICTGKDPVVVESTKFEFVQLWIYEQFIHLEKECLVWLLCFWQRLLRLEKALGMQWRCSIKQIEPAALYGTNPGNEKAHSCWWFCFLGLQDMMLSDSEKDQEKRKDTFESLVCKHLKEKEESKLLSGSGIYMLRNQHKSTIC